MSQDTIGAVMPYFALDYLPFQTMPQLEPGHRHQRVRSRHVSH